MSKKRITWAEIKDIVNKLPEDILAQKAIIWTESEEEGHVIASIKVLDEDYHYDGDEGCVPISVMKDVYDDYEENKDEYHLVHRKGTPILIIPDRAIK